MVNNSSLNKWRRLQTKNIDQHFINEIVTGLNCSPFEATAVLDTVHEVFDPYFETGGALKPGQILFQVVSVKNGPQIPLARCELVTATLTYDAGEEDLMVKKKSGIGALRKHRLERLCFEAYDQGGLLTVEDLANRIFNCGERTICRDLAFFREKKKFIPLRSTVKDMGRTLSHRKLIVEHWLAGKEYTEIARCACHSVRAVQNYVEKFTRVVALSRNGFDINTVSFVAKVAAPVVSEYLQIYVETEIIAHRQEELKSFLKKTLGQTDGGSTDDRSF